MNAANVTRLRPHAPPTLLVVEDDVVTRFTVADELRTRGFRVLEASDAGEAMTILAGFPVHLLFADVCIAGEASGLAVAKAARSRRPAPHVILTAGCLRPEEIADLAELGAFVPKPYALDHVADLVSRTLDPTAER